MCCQSGEEEVYAKLEVTYPEVDLDVAATAKLLVANLEGNGHLVIGVECLVEAFARVRSQLNVVGSRKA